MAASQPFDNSLWAQILQGRSPYGTSGTDVMNSLASTRSGNGQLDPALAQFFSASQNSGENGSASGPIGANSGSPFDSNGFYNLNGQQYVQVGGIPDDQRVQNRDPSMFTYDPTAGLITPSSNIKAPQDDPFSKYFPMIAMGLLGGTALSGAMGGLGDIPAGDPFAGAQAEAFGSGSGAGSGFGGGAGGAAAGSPFEGAVAGGAANGPLPGPLSSLLGGDFSGAASGLFSSALSNPIQALGLFQMAHGLISGNKGPTSSSTSGSSKPQGGTGVPGTTPGRSAFQFQPNQQTATQLSQYLGGR
jgi:hypothetical protein